jgi:hypothetical protein
MPFRIGNRSRRCRNPLAQGSFSLGKISVCDIGGFAFGAKLPDFFFSFGAPLLVQGRRLSAYGTVAVARVLVERQRLFENLRPAPRPSGISRSDSVARGQRCPESLRCSIDGGNIGTLKTGEFSQQDAFPHRVRSRDLQR